MIKDLTLFGVDASSTSSLLLFSWISFTWILRSKILLCRSIVFADEGIGLTYSPELNSRDTCPADLVDDLPKAEAKDLLPIWGRSSLRCKKRTFVEHLVFSGDIHLLISAHFASCFFRLYTLRWKKIGQFGRQMAS